MPVGAGRCSRMSVNYTRHGNIAVIEFDNPPVNGLGLVTRTACVQGLQQAQQDPAIEAIVLIGAGKVFSGGADIREFDSPKALTEPTLHTLIRSAETASKPVVAAIHAVCMGGGLELALGCHYRLALADAQIALPEVKLGLLPGAGGTQRLPRMVGVERALSMIVSGAPVRAEQLADTALFDRVFAPGTALLAAALEFAASIAHVRPLPLVRERALDGHSNAAIVQAARAKVAADSGPLPAPRACVEAVAAALDSASFEDGLLFERDAFLRLRETSESKALRHAFFAERAAGKVPGLAPSTPQRQIQRAAVIGGGTMGTGIALCFVNVGLAVTLVERDAPALERALAAIRSHDQARLDKGRITAEQLERRQALVTGTLVLADVASADIVVEAVNESMDSKLAVFAELDRIMPAGAILATNTSTLDVDRIAASTQRPGDVIGMHFFSPAPVMKLLEVVRAEATSDEVLATVLALARRLKKTAVVSRVCDGFIGNRMLSPYLAQALQLLEEGATPLQVDRALQDFGFAMGPFAMLDLAGNDVGWRIRRERAAQGQPVHAPLADALCEQGRFGHKSGAGWYDYPNGVRAPQPSPMVQQMINAWSQQAAIAQREISDQEIVERLVYALVNEGATLLAQGIALRASDIDMVYLAGYGFPLYRGGPMFYADTVGLAQVLARMQVFARGRHGAVWAPAPLLLRLAQEGRGFND